MISAVSSGMSPGVVSGDCRYVRYLNDHPERLTYGVVILFHRPQLDADYFFRIVALGGDTIQMVDGTIWLNDQPLAQTQIEDYERIYEPEAINDRLPVCQNQPALGEICRAEQFIEYAPNGAIYSILNTGESVMDNTEIFEVPEGHVFVMGDHRDNALDSRFFSQSGPFRGVGFVPVENIIGVMEEIPSALWK